MIPIGDTDDRPGCAACKFMERTCVQGCILAPYFPPECEPHFAAAQALLGADNAVALVRDHSTVPRRGMDLAEAIATSVTEQGNYEPQATYYLSSALYNSATEFGSSSEENLPLQTLQEFNLRSTTPLEGSLVSMVPPITMWMPSSDDESLASLDHDQLLKTYEEPEVVRRSSGRELTPAGAAVMGRIWDSFVEAMELPLPVAIMELQQSGVLSFDDDCEEPGPSDRDRDRDREEEKEESSSGTKNEGGGNNPDDIA